MNNLPEWGPSDQYSRAAERKAQLTNAALIVAFVLLLVFRSTLETVLLLVAVALRLGLGVYRRLHKAEPPRLKLASAPDPLAAVLEYSRQLGGGVYLGADRSGGWVCARQEHAVLLLGPPRSGKTSAVMIPAVLAHPGPVVCASTKPDVLTATAQARFRLGQVWEFDRSGSARS